MRDSLFGLIGSLFLTLAVPRIVSNLRTILRYLFDGKLGSMVPLAGGLFGFDWHASCSAQWTEEMVLASIDSRLRIIANGSWRSVGFRPNTKAVAASAYPSLCLSVSVVSTPAHAYITLRSPLTTRPIIWHFSPLRSMMVSIFLYLSAGTTRTMPIPMLKVRIISSCGTLPSFCR
jgi:hypothetical protein